MGKNLNKIKEYNYGIDIKIKYSTEEEKEQKINNLNSFLQLINEPGKTTKNIRLVNDFFDTIRGKKKSKISLFLTTLASITIILLSFLFIFEIKTYDGKIVSNNYFGQETAIGYYFNKELGIHDYGEFKIDGCSKEICITNKGKIYRRMIDFYILK